MIRSYKEKKDLYATIACTVFNNTYWDNMEHFEDGSPNPEGKKRRSFCKSILLGIMYGRGEASIAEQTGVSVKEARKIIDDFYNGFPSVKEWVKNTEEDAKVNGYVEDFWGRRRRLPDIQLPKYTVKLKQAANSVNFNPILFTKGILSQDSDPRISKYTTLINNCKGWKDAGKVKADAEAEGVSIVDNGAFISQAERQCVNARVQGGAATMTKIAMRKIYDDPELRRLGFKLLLTVHDEVIGKCNESVAEQAAERLSYIMSTSVSEYMEMPFSCDPEIEFSWYFNTYEHEMVKELADRCKKYPQEQAFQMFREEHVECTPEEAEELIQDYLATIH